MKLFPKTCLDIPLESGLGGHLVSFNFYDLWPPASFGTETEVVDSLIGLSKVSWEGLSVLKMHRTSLILSPHFSIIQKDLI